MEMAQNPESWVQPLEQLVGPLLFNNMVMDLVHCIKEEKGEAQTKCQGFTTNQSMRNMIRLQQ